MNPPFLNVTVPVDRSEVSQRGIDYAIALARGGGAIHFCSVIDAFTAGSEADAHRACLEAVAAAERSGIAADGRVLHGPVATAISQYAKDTGSDAIVIGTHARRGISRVVFGSVAESVLAMSDIPLVVTHADDVSRADGPVTVALDGSAPSRAALALGIELARAWEVSLAIENVTGTEREDWQNAASLLDDSAAVARAADVDFELVTATGKTPDTIVDGGERRRSSAIVVGTGAHSAAARFLLGSVATTVLERARVPVFVVPQP